MYEYKRYNHDTYMLPIWEGNEIYNETVMFLAEDSVPLLYRPDEIISVMSYDLKTEYEKGRDYELIDGMLKRLDGSRIPVFAEDEYYPENPAPGTFFGSAVKGHKYIIYGEGTTFFSRQVHVTYTHSDNWWGPVPKKSDKFGKFIEKASKGEEVTVLFFGDSITTGVCSSKTVGSEPNADCWCEMVVESFKKYFKNDKIKYINTAVGGMNSDWAIETVKENAVDIHPDLMFLAFGMNDGWLSPDGYAKKTKTIIDRFLEGCPDAEVAAVATMLPHSRVAGFYCAQELQQDALYELCSEYDNVGVIPVTSMHRALLEKKRYYDMTGNNVNHPNDFLARIYAQTSVKTILG